MKKKERKKITAKEIVIDFFICLGFSLVSVVGFVLLYDYTIGQILSLACIPGALFGILFIAKFVQFLIDAAGRVSERDERDKQRTEMLNKIGEAAPAPSAADEIAKYKALLDSGAITEEEFEAKKKQLLGL